MGYKPSLSDLREPSSSNAGYQPSLADLREPPKQKDDFPWPNQPYVGRSPTPEETSQAAKNFGEGAIGVAQGALNIPGDTLNMVNPTSHQIPRFNFAPETPASKIGQAASPFMGPQALETGALSIASYLPKALNALKGLTQAKKGQNALNALKSAAKTGARVGYVNALENPENPWPEFGKGAAMGAGGDILAPLALSGGRAASLIGKAGLGGGAGYLAGQAAGSESPIRDTLGGASAVVGLPLRRLAGMEPSANIVNEMLQGVNEREAMPVIEANRRLGTNATPGQAGNNYVTAAGEGRVKTTGSDVAHHAVELEKNAAKQQTNAFGSMLDKIYEPTKKNENAISRLYKLSRSPQYDIDPVIVNAMAQEPIVKQAMEYVSKMPDMENVPMNNYKYLQRVKQRLDTMHREMRSSSEGSDRLQAGSIGQVRDVYNKFLGDNNPAYKQANALAHPRFVREDITDLVNRMPEDATGKQVYSALFRTAKREKEVMQLVKNFPEAKKDIQDMKVGWKHLSDMKSPGQGHAQAASNIDLIRNTGDYLKNMLIKMGSQKGSMARLDYINNPGWEKGFAQRAEIANQVERNKALSKYLMETASKTGLPQDQVGNLLSFLNGTESDSKK